MYVLDKKNVKYFSKNIHKLFNIDRPQIYFSRKKYFSKKIDLLIFTSEQFKLNKEFRTRVVVRIVAMSLYLAVNCKIFFHKSLAFLFILGPTSISSKENHRVDVNKLKIKSFTIFLFLILFKVVNLISH